MDAGPSGSNASSNTTQSKVTRSSTKQNKSAATKKEENRDNKDVFESKDKSNTEVKDVNEPLKQELYYLIIKFLETGPCAEVATRLKALCETNQLLPPRKDWTGQSHVRSFDEFDRFHPHVTGSHLVDVCSAICPLLERAFPGATPAPGASAQLTAATASLLGGVVRSLLRSPADHGSIHLTLSQSFPTHRQGFRMPINCVKSKRNVPNCILQSAYDQRHRLQLECAIFKRLKLRKRIVGHGNSVYCVVFDRTSRFVITGADDSLIKVWCCRTLRLLATLRGHRNEICDLAVSHDNRLLASGACDKRVMVWRLDSCAPVAVLSLHTSAIISVAFSPSVRGAKRWLASTAKDGCVCFWAYDPVSLAFEDRPMKFIERSRPGCCMMCSCFSAGGGFFVGGCSDHAIRVYSFQPGLPEKIGELEGHRGSVDSVAYSHLDDRFASCSTDGSCRVWSYSRQLWRSLVLCPPGQPQQARGVSWTADDRCIVTTHSNHLVHCWDSRRGHLLAVFRDHRDDVFVVDCHPCNPRLFLTAGYDGKIAVRDLESTNSAYRHVNQANNTRQPVSLFEAKFSPDGDTLAVVDAVGHLLVFSLASDDSTDAQALDEQFFHTDFSPPPVLDSNGWPLDEATQRPPHLMPPPYLVDALMQPYQAEIQRRVPGRESLPIAELIPYCRTDDAGDMRVVDDSIAESVAARDRVFGPPRSYLQRSVWLSRQLVPPLSGAQLAQSVARRQAAGDREVRQFCIECRLRPPDQQAPNLARSSRQQQQQQQAHNPLLHQQQALMQSVGGVSSGQQSLSSAAVGGSGGGQSADQQLQRDPQLPISQQQHPALSQALPVESTMAVASAATTNRLTARALYDTDVETCGSGEDVDRVYAQLEAAGDDSSDDRTTESEYSDWLADEGAGRMAMPKRVQRRKVRRSAAAAAFAAATSASTSGAGPSGASMNHRGDGSDSSGSSGTDDDDDEESETTATSTTSDSSDDGDNSESSEDEEGDAESPAAPRQSRSRSRGQSASSKAKDKSASTKRKPTLAPAASLPRRSSSRRLPARTAASYDAVPLSNRQQKKKLKLSEDYRPPEWLTSTLPRHSPYVPQIGDEIVYFRQGHQLYINTVEATNAYKVDRDPPWLRMPDLSPHEQMKVSGMKPLLKHSPRLVQMTLAFADCSRGKFQLRFHDMDNVLDFMVLRQTYDRALQRNWKVGDRFRAIIDDYWWSGCIVGIAACEEAFPDSYWLSVRAKWDSEGTEECLSLWDLHPLIVGDDGSELANENRPVTASEFANLQYSPCEREWPQPGGRPAECNRIATALDYLIDLPVFSEFAKPVDLDLYPSYGFMIAYPIDLSTIRSRLRNMYYRRLLSVQYDVRFLANNAEYFNEAETVIVRRARLLTDLLLEFIRRTECTDVGRLYREMLDELTDENRDGLHLSEFEDDDDALNNDEQLDDDNDKEADIGDEADDSDSESSEASSEDDKDFDTKTTAKKRKISDSEEENANVDHSSEAGNDQQRLTAEEGLASASSSLPGPSQQHQQQQPLWTRLCYRVLAKLSQRDESLPFQHPVDLEAYPDYLDVVSDPIDLSTARQRLSNGCYASPLEFFRDLQRMFSNSRAYNTVPTSRIYQMTLTLQREFERLMNGALKRWRRMRAKGQDVSLVAPAATGAAAACSSSSVTKKTQQDRCVISKRRKQQQGQSIDAVVSVATPTKRPQQQQRRTASAAPNRGRSAAAAASSSSALANGSGGLRKRSAQVNYCESDDTDDQTEGSEDSEATYSESTDENHQRRDNDRSNLSASDSQHQQLSSGGRHPRTRRQVQRQQRRHQRRHGPDRLSAAAEPSASSTRPKRRRPAMVVESSDEEENLNESKSTTESGAGEAKRPRRSKSIVKVEPAVGVRRSALRRQRPDYRAMLEDTDDDEDSGDRRPVNRGRHHRAADVVEGSDAGSDSIDSNGRPGAVVRRR